MAYKDKEARRLAEYARADAKRKILDDIKLLSGCADCGYNKDARALEFDHLPEFEKVRTVSSLCYASMDAIWEELRKCEVVCANCHAIRTHSRRSS